MIDLESMNQSLGLAQIKKIFGRDDVPSEAHSFGTWKSYLQHLQNQFGCVFFLLLHCSYDFEDNPTTTQFYTELLKWWSDVREKFVTERVRNNVWNNKEIRINNIIACFYIKKKSFELVLSKLLTFLRELNNVDSFKIISKKINRANSDIPQLPILEQN